MLAGDRITFETRIVVCNWVVDGDGYAIHKIVEGPRVQGAGALKSLFVVPVEIRCESPTAVSGALKPTEKTHYNLGDSTVLLGCVSGG